MPTSDSTLLPDLPPVPTTTLLHMSPVVLDCLRKLAPLIEYLEDEHATAYLHISIERGRPTTLRVERKYSLQ